MSAKWEMHRPSQRERAQGTPEYRVVLAGDTWADIQEAWEDCQRKTGHVQPVLGDYWYDRD